MMSEPALCHPKFKGANPIATSPDLGPRRIEKVVAQAVDARCDLFDSIAAVGAEEELCHVADDETERSIARTFGLNPLQVRPRLDVRAQEIRDELSARARRVAVGKASPVIGHSGESS